MKSRKPEGAPAPHTEHFPSERHARPYERLAQELKARMVGSSRIDLMKQLAGKRGRPIPISKATLDSVLAGRRPIPKNAIAAVASLVRHSDESTEEVLGLLESLNRPTPTRTVALEQSKAKLKLGYIPFYPFAREPHHAPAGLMIDLLTLFCTLSGFEAEWISLTSAEILPALQSGMVDLVTSFIVGTVGRQAHASFFRLPLPFFLDLNAVTTNPEIGEDLPYSAAMEAVRAVVKAPESRAKIVVGSGEIAETYWAAIFAGVEQHHVESHNQANEELIKTYAIDRLETGNIVVTDAVSCKRMLRSHGRLHRVFRYGLGRFRIGFLAPAHDQQWGQFLSDSFRHMIRARLPQMGLILSRYAEDLVEFTRTCERPLVVAGREYDPDLFLQNVDAESGDMRSWLRRFWPRPIEVPAAWEHFLVTAEPNSEDKATGALGRRKLD
jgi:hypothetical protein